MPEQITEKPKQAEIVHASDCAVHNAPALPTGPCDCGAATAMKEIDDAD